jgi:hypothetical protein
MKGTQRLQTQSGDKEREMLITPIFISVRCVYVLKDNTVPINMYNYYMLINTFQMPQTFL